MCLVPFGHFGKNPFEPTGLFLSDPFIHKHWLVTDDKLLAAAVTAEGAQFPWKSAAFSLFWPFLIAIAFISPVLFRGFDCSPASF